MGGFREVIFWLIAGSAAAVGIWLGGYGLRRLLLPNPERRWRPVEGTIIESCIDEQGEEGEQSFRPRVTYQYQFDHLSFVGDRIAPLGSLAGMRWAARRTFMKYPRGRQVTVYVNPRNPGESVLEPGRQVPAALGHILAGAALLYWAWMLVSIDRSTS